MMGKIAMAAVMLTILLPSTAFAATFPFEYEGKTVEITYESQGVTINDIQTDFDFVSLIFDVDASGSPGILEVTLERAFFDSVYQGVDDPYIIIADADEAVFEEIGTTLQSRVLRIEIPSGTDEIEIIGTDFGTPGTSTPEPVAMPDPITEPDPVAMPDPISEPEPEVISEPEVPETPTEEPETEEKPKTVCGPGTVLRDGVCALEQKCGAGTILQDGQCVLDASAPAAPSVPQDAGRQLVISIIAAFAIALGVIFVLWLIGRA